MGFFSSGNSSVDELGKMNIMGNVTPQIWYKTILKPTTGKPYLLAIAVLSDIVYWYRPTELRDEMSGNVIGWSKKFHGDLLQKSYSDYAEMFGESKKTIREAMDCLENLGIIRRDFRNVKFGESMVACNVLYIDLCVEKLYEITYPEKNEKTISNSPETQQNQILPKRATSYSRNGQDDIAEMGSMVLPKSDTPYSRNGQQVLPKSDTPYSRNGQQVLPKSVTLYSRNGQDGIAEMGNTNTENTTEITNINKFNHINQSKSNIKTDANDMIDAIDGDTTKAYIELIKKNIDYVHHMMYDDKYDNERLEEIFNIICDVVCVPRKTIRVGKEDYPYELVKSRFLKLEYSHVEYVIDRVRNATSKITNIRAYIITALYNAPATKSLYIDQEVQHDMFGGGWNEKTDI